MVKACKNIATKLNCAVSKYRELSNEQEDPSSSIDDFSTDDCFKFISSCGLLLNDLTWESDYFCSGSNLKLHVDGNETAMGSGSDLSAQAFSKVSLDYDQHRRNILDMLSSIRAISACSKSAVLQNARIVSDTSFRESFNRVIELCVISMKK